MKTRIKVVLAIALVVTLIIAGIALGVFSLNRRFNSTALYLTDLDTRDTLRITQTNSNITPDFSPDGRFIAYAHRIPGARGKKATSTIEVLTLGKGTEHTVVDNASYNYSPTWSPDMKHIYYASDQGGQRDIWRLELDTAASEKVTDDKASERDPRVSPDGKWILFEQDDTEKKISEVYIIPSGGGEKRRITETVSILMMPKSPAWLPNSSGIAVVRLVEVSLLDLEGNVTGTIDLAGLNNIDELNFNPVRTQMIFKGRPARELSFQFYLYLFDVGTNELRPIRKSGFVSTGYDFSPDGRQIVYSK